MSSTARGAGPHCAPSPGAPVLMRMCKDVALYAGSHASATCPWLSDQTRNPLLPCHPGIGIAARRGARAVVRAGAVAADPDSADSLSDVDAMLTRLADKKAEWAATSLDERIAVLREIKERLLDKMVPWARAVAAVRRTTRDHHVALDLVSTAAVVEGEVDGLLFSLEHLRSSGHLPRPSTTLYRGDHAILDVSGGTGDMPHDGWQSRVLAAAGISVEMYLQPGKPETQGHFYREPHGGRLAVVLGAGNHHHLALSDVLHMAFTEGCVVALKYHPLMPDVAPFIDYVLQPLARRGYYASTAAKDIAVAQRLLYSPLTDCVHMTGGGATHDAIVWGASPEEQARRKAENNPLLKVPITSELGCVSPWLLVPGPWTDGEIAHHARALAEGIGANCSCNCLSPKVVLLPEGWPLSDAFIAALKRELSLLPPAPPYYPGTRERYEAFAAAYPAAQRITPREHDVRALENKGADGLEPLPWLVNELPAWPQDPSAEYAFHVEPFAPVITFVKVPPAPGASSLEEGYLLSAVSAANDHLHGSLSCSIFVHPATEASHGAVVTWALDHLRYGTVTVNAWAALAFIVNRGHWGAYGGGPQTLHDAGSGLGVVHNTLMFDHSAKCVVRSPFWSLAHMVPERYLPIPLPAAKMVAGLVHGGPGAAVKMMARGG